MFFRQSKALIQKLKNKVNARPLSTSALSEPNCYSLQAFPDEKVMEGIQGASSEIAKCIPGFTPTRLPYHVSLGYSHSTPDVKLGHEEAEHIKVKLTSEVKRVLESHINRPFHMMPETFYVSPRRWLCLTLNATPASHQAVMTQLHHEFIDVLEQKEYKQHISNAKIFRNGFKAHISFGKVKANLTTEHVSELAQHLKQKANALPALSFSRFTLLRHQTPLVTVTAAPDFKAVSQAKTK